MDNSVIVALISAGGSALIAVTALVLNYRGFSSIDARFSSMDARFSSLEGSINTRFGSIDRRLELMQQDMKDLNKTMTSLEIDVALLKDKAGQ